MEKKISLHEVTDTLESLSEGIDAFLDRQTGEIIIVTEDDRFELDADDPDHAPEWQREHLAFLRETLETDRLVPLPSQYDIHEWSIMESFCGTVQNPRARDQLYDAIGGKGAFRMFRSTLDRLGLRKEWHAYRTSALEEIARDWLEENGIPFQ